MNSGPGRRVVAIDGPAGVGKSTVAREVARRLDLPVLDTGAMYRAVTFAALRQGIDPSDAESLGRLAHSARIEVGDRVVVDGLDVTAEIRGADVTAAVSAVSAVPAVRQELVARQREWVAGHGGAVVEGRDIGSVVFPDAAVKVFLTADPATRAERRWRDEEAADGSVTVDGVHAALTARDRFDSGRTVAPLVRPPDALEVDTTDLGIDEVVERVVQAWAAAGVGR